MKQRGLAWPLVRESLQENNTIENMERIFKVAKAHGFQVFISPHYFYTSLAAEPIGDQAEPSPPPRLGSRVRPRLPDGKAITAGAG
jgi:hypothetical protein